eukprot:1216105-Prymnesium_polylepis.1
MGPAFPRTVCFVQADCESFVIRWSHRHFICLQTVVDVRFNLARANATNHLSVTKQHSSGRFSGTDSLDESVGGAAQVNIEYIDRGGLSAVLRLGTHAVKARGIAEGLRAVLKMDARIALPAQWHWTVSCMAATSQNGKTGVLQRSELLGMLRRANASASIDSKALQAALVEAAASDQLLPQWMRMAATGGKSSQRLCLRQVVGLLLELSTSSTHIATLFEQYAVDGRMGVAEWLGFVAAEQLGTYQEISNASPSNVAGAKRSFENAVERASTELHSADSLGLRQFALQLLSPQNDAIMPARRSGSEPERNSLTTCDDLHSGLCHYWTACSHNVQALELPRTSCIQIHTQIHAAANCHALRSIQIHTQIRLLRAQNRATSLATSSLA